MVLYEYENQCGSCAEYTFEGKDTLGYCKRVGAYYYPDDSCRNYVERGSGSSGCFLTSACCKAKNLPDDCKELESLRYFRDNILINMTDGKEMIDFYYAQAPRIVKQIDNSVEPMKLYEEIYFHIKSILNKIDEKNYEKAVIEYLCMMYTADINSRKEELK